MVGGGARELGKTSSSFFTQILRIEVFFVFFNSAFNLDCEESFELKKRLPSKKNTGPGMTVRIRFTVEERKRNKMIYK